MTLPIVLLHAFPLSSLMFEPLRTALPATCQLITPDVRGASGDGVPLLDVSPSLDVLADDVADLLDAHGIARAIIGGVSMGGYVTMAFLRRHPERAAAVVFADTKANADAGPARANRLRIAEALDTEGNTRVLVDDVLPTLLGSTTKSMRPDVAVSVEEMVRAASPASAAWWQRAMSARPDSFETLRALRAPALVIVGDEDALVSSTDADAMLQALPDGRLTELPAAGHLSVLETPQAFAAALAGFAEGLT